MSDEENPLQKEDEIEFKEAEIRLMRDILNASTSWTSPSTGQSNYSELAKALKINSSHPYFVSTIKKLRQVGAIKTTEKIGTVVNFKIYKKQMVKIIKSHGEGKQWRKFFNFYDPLLME